MAFDARLALTKLLMLNRLLTTTKTFERQLCIRDRVLNVSVMLLTLVEVSSGLSGTLSMCTTARAAMMTRTMLMVPPSIDFSAWTCVLRCLEVVLFRRVRTILVCVVFLMWRPVFVCSDVLTMEPTMCSSVTCSMTVSVSIIFSLTRAPG